jgi:cytochrome c oxidase subunit II
MSPEAAGTEDQGHGRRFLVIWLVLSVIATPLVAIFLGPALPPGNDSTQASGQVLDNTVLVTAITPVCLLVLLFVGYVLIAFREREGAPAGDGPADRGDARLQAVWVVATTAVVIGLAAFGTYELVLDGAGGGQGPSAAFLPADHAKAMDVQVIGQQWAFTYRYPSYGGLETPQLVLPSNTLIRLHVTSLDVVHSFWAYQLGVKADANPGVDNVVYVQLKGPQTFSIRCAELCGLWHGYMFDTGRIVPQAQFTAWIAQERSTYASLLRYLPPYATSYLPEPTHRAG